MRGETATLGRSSAHVRELDRTAMDEEMGRMAVT
jgi:hypothetical protein